jgi:hypothetical protein
MRLALANSAVRGVMTEQPALLKRILDQTLPTDHPAW